MKSMRPLMLDFQNDRRTPPWFSVVLLLSGVVMTLYLSIHSADLLSELSSLEEEQIALERKSKHKSDSPRPAAIDAPQLQAEIRQANEVLERLALPWDPLFKEIESSPTIPIALLAVEPDTAKRLITITGEAKNLEAMLNYIRLLQGKKSLAHVYLKNHHIEMQIAEQPVRFVVVASWVTRS
jgi:Tfp pilus assembly protein PilN